MIDMKAYGLPKPRQLGNLELSLIVAIILLLAYWLLSPAEPAYVKMTKAAYQRAIAQARIDAAREAMNATTDRECFMDWKTRPKTGTM